MLLGYFEQIPHVGGMRTHTKQLVILTLAILLLTEIGAVASVPPVPQPGAPPSWRAERLDRAIPRPYSEMSGLASSRRYPGVAWGVRDSGNPAALYALRLDVGGQRVSAREFRVTGASNRDWEDVVYKEVGTESFLYVVDTGAKRIYRVREPDPDGMGPAVLVATYRYALPDKNPRSTCGPADNVEAAFLFPPLNGALHLVRKMGSPATVLRFSSLSADRVNVPGRVGKIADARCISVASVSEDGRLLVTAAHESLRIRQGRGDLPSLLAGPVVHGHRLAPDNTEGGDFYSWGNDGVLLVAENRTVWHLAPG